MGLQRVAERPLLEERHQLGDLFLVVLGRQATVDELEGSDEFIYSCTNRGEQGRSTTWTINNTKRVQSTVHSINNKLSPNMRKKHVGSFILYILTWHLIT